MQGMCGAEDLGQMPGQRRGLLHRMCLVRPAGGLRPGEPAVHATQGRPGQRPAGSAWPYLSGVQGRQGGTDNWTDDDACDDDPDDGDDPYEDDEQSSTSLSEESTSGSSSDPDESSTPEDEEIEDDPIPYANSKDIFNAIENIWAGKKPKKPGWLKTPGKKKKAGKPKTKAKPKAKKGLGWNGPTLEKKVKDYHKKKAWDKKKSLEKKKAKKDSGWNSVNIEKMLKEHLKKWGQDREDKEVW